MVVNQENDQVLTDLRGYGALSGVEMSDILPRCSKVQFGSFSAKSISGILSAHTPRETTQTSKTS